MLLKAQVLRKEKESMEVMAKMAKAMPTICEAAWTNACREIPCQKDIQKTVIKDQHIFREKSVSFF